jgi:hypothetical protein
MDRKGEQAAPGIFVPARGKTRTKRAFDGKTARLHSGTIGQPGIMRSTITRGRGDSCTASRSTASRLRRRFSGAEREARAPAGVCAFSRNAVLSCGTANCRTRRSMRASAAVMNKPRASIVVGLTLATWRRAECRNWVTSGGLRPTLRRRVDPRQRTPPATKMASGSGQNRPLAPQQVLLSVPIQPRPR